MKCDIIKDLLPLYIDGLTSEASNEEIELHLESCEDCLSQYKDMKETILSEIPVATDKEIDFLKKIKRRNIKSILMWVGVTVGALLIVLKLFVWGFAVNSEDMEMTQNLLESGFEIQFNLTNGHDLSMKSERNSIYDENKNKIGFENIYKPYWIINNPFDDVGAKFSLGAQYSERSTSSNYINKDIIRFKDKDIVFINGKLAR